jgi:hypothetical protein
MYNIYDIRSRCNKKYLYLTIKKKMDMKNEEIWVIDQHKIATCQMQSL